MGHNFIVEMDLPESREAYEVTARFFDKHLGTGAKSGDVTEPIKVGPDGHFLSTYDGQPFFWLGDIAWDLFQRLNREDADRYLRDRAAKGFTVIQAVIGGASSHQGANIHGESVFIDNDPSRPNERYFENVDWIIQRAQRHGLRMAVLPYWAGAFQARYGEVSSPLKPLPVQFDENNAESYGRWLGNRYRDRGMIWIFGGDANPIWPRMLRWRTDASGNSRFSEKDSDLTAQDWRPFYDALAKGIADGEGRRPFITYHPNCCTFPGMPMPLMSNFFADRPWLTMNMIQSSHYSNPPEKVHGALIGFSAGWRGPYNYLPIAHEFASTPTRPLVDGEPLYEDLGVDNDAARFPAKGIWQGYDARNAAYHAVFAGAAGHTYGNHAIWQFAGPDVKVDPPITPRLTWQEALQRPVASQLRHLKTLMLSHPYFTRVPDQSLIVGDAGEGAAHIAATRDTAGRYALIYIPDGRPVTIDLTKLPGARMSVSWFDPRTGEAQQADAQIPLDGIRTFTPPTSGRDQDWVLVISSGGKSLL
jgi:hypothetical protein